MALVGNDLYVANTDAIVRYPYMTGDTTDHGERRDADAAAGRPDRSSLDQEPDASRDGSLLYVGVGSNSNITENGMEAEKNRAAIWEVDRATGRWRIFASGLRNPNGLTWEPESGALWAVVNERDELGPNLVPDYMTSVKDGGFYGWPYSYYGQHLDPRVQPQRPDLVEKAIVPDYALSSHVAPLGLVFYTGDSLAAKISRRRVRRRTRQLGPTVFNGYKVVFVPFSGGHPNGKAEDVVTGFLDADGKARGRPVGLAVDKTGALLIADDVGNTVGASPLLDNNPALRTIEVVFAGAAHRSGRQADSALAWKPGSNVLSSCGLSDKILQRKSIVSTPRPGQCCRKCTTPKRRTLHPLVASPATRSAPHIRIRKNTSSANRASDRSVRPGNPRAHLPPAQSADRRPLVKYAAHVTSD